MNIAKKLAIEYENETFYDECTCPFDKETAQEIGHKLDCPKVKEKTWWQNMKKELKTLNRRETIYVAMAIRDAYMGFDQEDYCYKETERCEKCFGCIQYRNLVRSYKIIKKLLPKI